MSPETAGDALTRHRVVANALVQAGAEVFVATERANVSWLLGGRGIVGGCGGSDGLTLVVDADEMVAVSSAEDCARLVHEERLGDIGVRVVSFAPQDGFGRVVSRLVGRRVAIHDAELESLLRPARERLTEIETMKLRRAGNEAAAALTATIGRIHPQTSEREACAELAFQTRVRGLVEERIWVAGETRQRAYGATAPSMAALGRHFLIGQRVARDGLHASLVRVVSFGTPTVELSWVVGVTHRVQECMHEHSIPGSNTDQVIAAAADLYVNFGLANEWSARCLGGLTGYTHADTPMSTRSSSEITAFCATAWRPSMRGGGCSHDTALVTARGTEIITRTTLPALESGIVAL